MTHGDWMRALAEHADRMRLRHPDDDLVLVFDIDGTIVDARYLVVHVLLSYDRHHGTDHFRGIGAADVVAHETRVDAVLEPFALAAGLRDDVRAWYLEHFRDPDAVAASHRPYEGVLSVIRWFQLQPRTRVALNTGRPESMREMTLASLNELGALHRVAFESELLFMNAGTATDEAVAAAKVEALRRLRSSGHRVVAVVDNEPSLIRAMAEADETGETLFLHADTIFASRPEPMPGTVSGSTYELSGLIDEEDLGRRVTLVWHGVNDRHTLHRFLSSNVRWAELDMRRDPVGRLVLRRDPFADVLWTRDEEVVTLAEGLERLAGAGRSIKLDLKEGGTAIIEALEAVAEFGLTDERLWFNASIEGVGREGFACLRRARPGALLQTPIDFLAPLLLAEPELAEPVLSSLRGWGISRVSLDWRTPGARDVLAVVEGLGWEVNLYGVPDLESFLEAALLLPASVTADFTLHRDRGPGRATLSRRFGDAVAAPVMA